MTTANTLPSAVCDVLSKPTAGETSSDTLIRTESFHVIRLTLARMRRRAEYAAAGDVLILCMAGRIAVQLYSDEVKLNASQFIHVPAHTPHSIRGIDDSTVVIINLACDPSRQDCSADASALSNTGIDIVQEASEESFPASDPPSRTPITSS